MNYIYDLDDTLIKNSDVPYQALNRMLKDILRGKTDKGLQTSGRPIERVKQLYARYHFLETRDRTEKGLIELAPGVREFLQETEGFQAGLTNAPYRSTCYKMEELDFEKFLDDIVTAREGLRKPSPEGIERIIQRSGLERDSFVFVGDSIKDLIAGKRAGLRTVLVTDDLSKKVLADEAYPSFQQFVEKH